MQQLKIERQLNAKANEVYQAWANETNFAQWWGHPGMRVDIKTFRFEPNGLIHYGLVNQNEDRMWGKFTYVSMIENQKIEFINMFSNEAGEDCRAPKIPFGKHWPMYIFNTLELSENEDGSTLMTLTGNPYLSNYEEDLNFAKNTKNMEFGFKPTFDRLEQFLTKEKV